MPILNPLLDFVFNMDRIQSLLNSKSKKALLQQKISLSSYMIALSFFISSLLNYLLAKWLVQSPPGTPEFNQELGRMTALSFPVIAVPSTLILILAIWLLIRHIKKATNLELDDIIKQQ